MSPPLTTIGETRGCQCWLANPHWFKLWPTHRTNRWERSLLFMLTCSQVVHQENLSLRSTLRMTGPLLEELWTGTSRTLLLILCSARLAFVDANGGAILPSLNKVLIDIGTPDKLAVRQTGKSKLCGFIWQERQGTQGWHGRHTRQWPFYGLEWSGWPDHLWDFGGMVFVGKVWLEMSHEQMGAASVVLLCTCGMRAKMPRHRLHFWSLYLFRFSIVR